MMLISFKPLSDWFGYTRRERRACFILLIVIAVIIAIRFIPFFSLREPEIVTFEAVQTEADSQEVRSSPASYTKRETPARRMGKRSVLELNSCDSASLVNLPAIGPVLARRIIRYRNLLGGFVSVSQLKEVYGISDSAFMIIEPLVKADSSMVSSIDLNTADYKRLARLPYLKKEDISSILSYRERKGKIESLDALVAEGIISAEKAKKIRGYVRVK